MGIKKTESDRLFQAVAQTGTGVDIANGKKIKSGAMALYQQMFSFQTPACFFKKSERK